MNNTETTEVDPAAEVTEISLPTSFTLIQVFEKPLQIPRKTIHSGFDTHFDPNSSEKFVV